MCIDFYVMIHWVTYTEYLNLCHSEPPICLSIYLFFF